MFVRIPRMKDVADTHTFIEIIFPVIGLNTTDAPSGKVRSKPPVKSTLPVMLKIASILNSSPTLLLSSI
jgi:hypothetical protein